MSMTSTHGASLLPTAEPFEPMAATANPAKAQASLHRYRPEIDGLRAIAVLSVLGFHGFPRWIHGGFVGVDIFFVISGYLISGIIYQELSRGTFSIAGFYSRRIKRIFPALLLIIVLTLTAGHFFFIADELTTLNGNVAASAAFVINFALLGQSGYFDASPDVNPLLHLWSLGIEEQFYIVWPLLLIGFWKRRVLVSVVLALLALSLLANLLLIGSHPIQTFYLPFTRFWELWVGALLAYHEYSMRQSAPNAALTVMQGTVHKAFPWLGLALLATATLLFRSIDPFPGWRAIVPVAGAALLIAGPRTSFINRTLLSNPIALFVGRISYPLYLWHWPILAYMRLYFDQTPRLYRLSALVAAAIAAWLTYRFVEHPVRFGPATWRKPVLLSAGMLVVGCFGWQQWEAQRNRHDAQSDYIDFFKRYTETHDLQTQWAFQCGFIDASGIPQTHIDPTCVPSTSQALLIWGDSHAQALRHGIAAVLPNDVALGQVATFGCHPSLSVGVSDDESCKRSNAYALAAIKEHRPAVVVLAQQSRHESTDWNALAKTLLSYGVQHIVLVGPCPEWMPNLYRVMVKDFAVPRPRRLASHLNQEIFATDRTLKDRYAHSDVLTYVSLIDALCTKDGCETYVGNDDREGLTTFDYGHLSLVASTYVADGAIGPALAPFWASQTP